MSEICVRCGAFSTRIIKGYCERCYGLKYRNRPEIRTPRLDQHRKYNNRQDVKARGVEYRALPEVVTHHREWKREYQKEYRLRPEVKLKEKEWRQKYSARPEVQAKRREARSRMHLGEGIPEICTDCGTGYISHFVLGKRCGQCRIEREELARERYYEIAYIRSQYRALCHTAPAEAEQIRVEMIQEEGLVFAQLALNGITPRTPLRLNELGKKRAEFNAKIVEGRKEGALK